MKHIRLILTLLAISGCTLDDAQENDPELELMFQPDMLMQVTPEGVGNFPQEQSIGISAWKLHEDIGWKEGAEEAEAYLTLCEASSKEVQIIDTVSQRPVSDVLWVIDNQPIWPNVNEHLTFMAFSPYSSDYYCDRFNGVTCDIDILRDQTDILYTDPVADRHKLRNGWVVPLHFKHALCEISFRVKNRVADDEDIVIQSISIDGVHHKGTFASLADPQWTLDESTDAWEIFEGEFETEQDPKLIGRTWLMLPQELDSQVNVKFKYTTFAETSINQSLKTISLKTHLQAGKSYVFTLSVGIDDVKFLTELIEHRIK